MYNRNDGSEYINALQNQFTAYLKTSLYRNKIRYMRKWDKLRTCEIPLEEYQFELFDEQTPLHILMLAIECEILQTALKSIKQRDRYILLAHVIDKKSFVEIAEELGIGYKAVTSAYYRIILKLRNILGGDFDGF